MSLFILSWYVIHSSKTAHTALHIGAKCYYKHTIIHAQSICYVPDMMLTIHMVYKRTRKKICQDNCVPIFKLLANRHQVWLTPSAMNDLESVEIFKGT